MRIPTTIMEGVWHNNYHTFSFFQRCKYETEVQQYWQQELLLTGCFLWPRHHSWQLRGISLAYRPPHSPLDPTHTLKDNVSSKSLSPQNEIEVKTYHNYTNNPAPTFINLCIRERDIQIKRDIIHAQVLRQVAHKVSDSE